MFLVCQSRVPACQSLGGWGDNRKWACKTVIWNPQLLLCSLMGEPKPSSLTHLGPPTRPARFQGEMELVRAPPMAAATLGASALLGERGWPSLSGRSCALAPSRSFPRLPHPLFSHTLCSPTQGNRAPAPQPIINQLHVGSWGGWGEHSAKRKTWAVSVTPELGVEAPGLRQ